MRYTVKRVSLRSALRLGFLLGGLVSLPPALLGAGIAVVALKTVNQALAQVTPITLSLLGQDLAQIDLLAALGLRLTAQTVGGLADRGLVAIDLHAVVAPRLVERRFPLHFAFPQQPTDGWRAGALFGRRAVTHAAVKH